jgi:hypothetical protein
MKGPALKQEKNRDSGKELLGLETDADTVVSGTLQR